MYIKPIKDIKEKSAWFQWHEAQARITYIANMGNRFLKVFRFFINFVGAFTILIWPLLGWFLFSTDAITINNQYLAIYFHKGVPIFFETLGYVDVGLLGLVA